jgi:hypothetical protein
VAQANGRVTTIAAEVTAWRSRLDSMPRMRIVPNARPAAPSTMTSSSSSGTASRATYTTPQSVEIVDFEWDIPRIASS